MFKQYSHALLKGVSARWYGCEVSRKNHSRDFGEETEFCLRHFGFMLQLWLYHRKVNTHLELLREYSSEDSNLGPSAYK